MALQLNTNIVTMHPIRARTFKVNGNPKRRFPLVVCGLFLLFAGIGALGEPGSQATEIPVNDAPPELPGPGKGNTDSKPGTQPGTGEKPELQKANGSPGNALNAAEGFGQAKNFLNSNHLMDAGAQAQLQNAANQAVASHLKYQLDKMSGKYDLTNAPKYDALQQMAIAGALPQANDNQPAPSNSSNGSSPQISKPSGSNLPSVNIAQPSAPQLDFGSQEATAAANSAAQLQALGAIKKVDGPDYGNDVVVLQGNGASTALPGSGANGASLKKNESSEAKPLSDFSALVKAGPQSGPEESETTLFFFQGKLIGKKAPAKKGTAAGPTSSDKNPLVLVGDNSLGFQTGNSEDGSARRGLASNGALGPNESDDESQGKAFRAIQKLSTRFTQFNDVMNERHQKLAWILKGLMAFLVIMIFAMVKRNLADGTLEKRRVEEFKRLEKMILEKRAFQVEPSSLLLAAGKSPNQKGPKDPKNPKASGSQYVYFDEQQKKWFLVTLANDNSTILSKNAIADGSVVALTRLRGKDKENVVVGANGQMRATSDKERIGVHVKGSDLDVLPKNLSRAN